MDASSTIVFELFNTLLDEYVTKGEARALRLMCGFEAGYGMLSARQIGQLSGLTDDQVRRVASHGLLKLPPAHAKSLFAYLSDGQHPFHGSLQPAQRRLLLSMMRQITEYRSKRPGVPATSIPQPDLPSAPASRVPSISTPGASPAAPVSHGESYRNRAVEIAGVMEEFGHPAAVETIQRVLADRATAGTNPVLTTMGVIQVLVNSRDFVALENGVFALTRWENRVDNGKGVQLRYCPPLPLPAGAPSDRLLELALKTQEWVTATPFTCSDVWLASNRELSAQLDPQILFDIWFAIGLFPNVRFQDVRQYRAVLSTEFPNHVQAARVYALETLCVRMEGMAELLAALSIRERASAEELTEAIYGIPDDPMDVPHRIRLLEAFGAVRSVAKRESWTLTRTGARLVEESPTIRAMVEQEMVETRLKLDESGGNADFHSAWDEFELPDL